MNAAYAAAALLARLIADFLAKHGETVLIIEQYDADYAQEYCTDGRSLSRTTVAREIESLGYDRYGREDLNTIVRDKNPLKCLLDILQEIYGEWGSASVITEEAWQNRKDAEERQRIDRAAADFAERAGCEVGTMELLDALKEAMDRADYQYEVEMGAERMAEDYAAHMMAGCRDSFWENRDYTRNQCDAAIDAVGEIWEWMEMNVPMTMALWREKRMAEDKE